MTGWIIFIILWFGWLLFMVLFPNKWDRIVEKENSFWTEKGIISKSFAEKIIRFEKGLGLKILVLISVVGAIIVLVLKSIINE